MMSRSGSTDSAHGATSVSRRSSYDIELPVLFPSIFTTTRERQMIADPWQLDNPAIRQLSSAARRRNRPRLHSAGSRLLLVDGGKTSSVNRAVSPPARLEKLPGNVSPREVHVHLPNDLPVLPGIRSPGSSPEPRSESETLEAEKSMLDSTGRSSTGSTRMTSSISLGLSEGAAQGFTGYSTYGSGASLRSGRASTQIQQYSLESNASYLTKSYRTDSKCSTDIYTDDDSGNPESSLYSSTRNGSNRREGLEGSPYPYGARDSNDRQHHIEIPSILSVGEDEEVEEHDAKSNFYHPNSNESDGSQSRSTNSERQSLSPQPPPYPKTVVAVHPTRRRHVDLEVVRKQLKEQVRKVIEGNMEGLMPAPSRSVRIYISSTGTDMLEEMNTMRKSVFPRLRQFCEERNLEFYALDLHSAPTDNLQGDTDLASMYLEDIKECQRLSLGPSFVALIGNKYGKYMLPKTIPQEDFNVLHTVLEMEEPEKADLLIYYYQLDESSIPSVYRLEEIKEDGENEEIGNTYENLVSIITSASRLAHAQDMMTDDCFQRLHATALEMELFNGIFNVKDAKKKSLAFCRDLDGLLDDLDNTIAPHFIDIEMHGENRCENLECADTLNHIKQSKLKRHLGDNNIHFYTPWWQEGGLDPGTCQRNSNYLNLFSRHFHDDVKRLINIAIKSLHLAWKGIPEATVNLYDDIHYHLSLAKQHSQDYIDLNGDVASVKNILKDEPEKILFIQGPAGSGKTCLLSELARTSDDLIGKASICVTRFLGAAPVYPNITSVLRSVCMQICSTYELDDDDVCMEMDDIGLYIYFRNLLDRISDLSTEGRELVIFVDSVHVFCDYSWMPRKLPRGVYLICTSTLLPSFMTPINSNVIHLQALPAEKAKAFSCSLLNTRNRKMNESQWSDIYGQLDGAISCQEAKLLSACALSNLLTGSENSQIPASITEVVMRIFDEAAKCTDKTLVRNVIGYLSVSPDGLTEGDLAEVLSKNQDVTRLVQERNNCEIPIHFEVVTDQSSVSYDITKIRNALEPLLSKTECRGRVFLQWSNTTVQQLAVSQYLSADTISASLHTDLLHLYIGKAKKISEMIKLAQMQKSNQPKIPYSRFLIERTHRLTLHHLAYSNVSLVSAKQLVLCNFQWLVRRLHFASISSLVQDFKMFKGQFHAGIDAELELLQDCLSSGSGMIPKRKRISLDDTAMDLYLILKTYLVFDPESHVMLKNLVEEGRENITRESKYFLIPVSPSRAAISEKLIEGQRISFFHGDSSTYIIEMTSTANGCVFELPNLRTINHRGIICADQDISEDVKMVISPDGKSVVTIEEGFVSVQDLNSGQVSKQLNLEIDGEKVILKYFTVNFINMIILAATSDDILMTIDLKSNEVVGRYPDETEEVNIVVEERKTLHIEDIEDREYSPLVSQQSLEAYSQNGKETAQEEKSGKENTIEESEGETVCQHHDSQNKIMNQEIESEFRKDSEEDEYKEEEQKDVKEEDGEEKNKEGEEDSEKGEKEVENEEEEEEVKGDKKEEEENENQESSQMVLEEGDSNEQELQNEIDLSEKLTEESSGEPPPKQLQNSIDSIEEPEEKEVQNGSNVDDEIPSEQTYKETGQDKESTGSRNQEETSDKYEDKDISELQDHSDKKLDVVSQSSVEEQTEQNRSSTSYEEFEHQNEIQESEDAGNESCPPDETDCTEPSQQFEEEFVEPKKHSLKENQQGQLGDDHKLIPDSQDDNYENNQKEDNAFTTTVVDASSDQSLNDKKSANKGDDDFHSNDIRCLKLSPDNGTLAMIVKVGNSCTLNIWTVQTWDKTATINISAIDCSSIYFSPNSSVLLVDLMPRNYIVIDVAEGDIQFTIDDDKDGALDHSSCAVFSTNSQYVVLPIGLKLISIFRVEDGEKVQSFESQDRCSLIALDPGENFVFGCEGTKCISIWQINSGAKIWTVASECGLVNDMTVVTWNRDIYLYTINDSNKCFSWNVTDVLIESRKRLLSSVTEEESRFTEMCSLKDADKSKSGINLIKNTPDGIETPLEHVGSIDSTVVQENIDAPGVNSVHHDVLLTPDGRFIITAHRELGIRMYDVTTTKHVLTIECPDVWNVMIANDGLTLVCITHSKHILFYTLERDRWQMIDRLHNITHLAVDGVSISADSRTIAVIRKDDFHRDHLHMYVIDLVTCHVMAHLTVNVDIEESHYQGLSIQLSNDNTNLMIFYTSSEDRPCKFVISDLYKEINMDVPSWTVGNQSPLHTFGSRIVTPLGISIEDYGSGSVEPYYTSPDQTDGIIVSANPGLLSIPMTIRDKTDHVYPSRSSSASSDSSENISAVSINVFEDNTVPQHLAEDGNTSMNPGLLGASLTSPVVGDISADAKATLYPISTNRTSSVSGEGTEYVEIKDGSSLLGYVQNDQTLEEDTGLRSDQDMLARSSGKRKESLGSLKIETSLGVIPETLEENLEDKIPSTPRQIVSSEETSKESDQQTDNKDQEPTTTNQNLEHDGVKQISDKCEEMIDQEIKGLTDDETGSANKAESIKLEDGSLDGNLHNSQVDPENADGQSDHTAEKDVTETLSVNSPSDNRPNSSSSDKHPNSSSSDKRPNSSSSDKRPNSSQSDKRPNTSQSDNRPNSSSSDKRPNSSSSDKRPNSSHSDNRPNSSQSDNRPNSSQSDKRPNSSQSDKRPNSSQSDKRPNSSQSDNRPNSSISDNRPNSSQSDKRPNSSSSDKRPNSSHSDNRPNSSSSDKRPNSSQSEKGPNSSSSDKRPNSSHSDNHPNSSQSDNRPNSSHSDNCPKSSQSDKRPNSSQSENHPNSSQSDNRPNSSHSDNCPNSSQSDKRPNSSQSDKSPNSSQSDKRPNSSSSDNRPNSSHSDNRPNSSQSDNRPNSSQSDKRPNSSSSDNRPNSSHSDNRPNSSQSDNRPNSSQSDKRPNSSQSDKRPNSSQSDNRPNSSQSDNRPNSSSSDKRPNSSQSDKRPNSSSLDNCPNSSSSNKRPNSSQSDKRPNSSQSDKRPNSSHSDNRSNSSSSDKRPNSSQSDKHPNSSSSDNRPNFSHSDNHPNSSQSDNRPNSSQSDKRPNSSQSDKRPNSSSSDNHPNSSSSDKCPNSSQSDKRPNSSSPDNRPNSSSSDNRPNSSSSNKRPSSSHSDNRSNSSQSDKCLNSSMSNNRPNSSSCEKPPDESEHPGSLSSAEHLNSSSSDNHPEERTNSTSSQSSTTHRNLETIHDNESGNEVHVSDTDPNMDLNLQQLENDALASSSISQGLSSRSQGNLRRLDSLSVITMPRPVRQASEMSLNLPFDFNDEPPADNENPTGRRRPVGHLLRYVNLRVENPQKCVATLKGPELLIGTSRGHLGILDLSSGVLQHVLVLEGQDNIDVIKDIIDSEMRDMEPSEESQQCRPHSGAITHVCRTRDFRFAVAASADKTLTVWQMERLKFMHRLEGHSDKVTWSDVSGDNSLIVSGSEDRTVRLWKLRSGTVLHTFNVQLPVFEVRFSFGDVHVMARMGRSGYGRFTVFRVHRPKRKDDVTELVAPTSEQ